ncbi:MAG: hypothetical protein JXX29_01565 [Deltaproteobacteria bacterium]|nr:hypothetical protein [Deltaproteobacteria bacterium]MBN2670327.1 hypothetical protein [Deltaproteobacteria bacterium]
MMVCAVISTQNSADHIESIVLRTRAILEPDIFVLDHESTDDTVAIARASGAQILSSESDSKGLMISALEQIQNLGFTHAVFLNANNASHVPEQIPMFVNAVWQSPHCIFVAQSKGTRRSTVSNALLSAGALRTIKDAWNNFRIYPVEDILALNCKEDGEHFAPEALVRASWAGIHTKHLELDASCPIEHEIAQSPQALFLSVKLLGGMLIRFPALLRRRLAL